MKENNIKFKNKNEGLRILFLQMIYATITSIFSTLKIVFLDLTHESEMQKVIIHIKTRRKYLTFEIMAWFYVVSILFLGITLLNCGM